MENVYRSDMTLEEFTEFVRPQLHSFTDTLPNDALLWNVVMHCVALAESQSVQALLNLLSGQGIEGRLTSRDVLINLFFLAVLCERNGWYLSEEP